jgi:hypothetical protein
MPRTGIVVIFLCCDFSAKGIIFLQKNKPGILRFLLPKDVVKTNTFF